MKTSLIAFTIFGSFALTGCDNTTSPESNEAPAEIHEGHDHDDHSTREHDGHDHDHGEHEAHD